MSDETRTFGPCSKCSGTDPRVSYHEGKMHCSACRSVESCRYSDACGDGGRRGQHLVVTCQRCHYGWVEPVSAKAAKLKEKQKDG